MSFVRTFVAALLLIALAESAIACQCGRERSIEEARAAAAYVVTGKVRGIHPAFVTGSRMYGPADLPLPRVWPVSIIDIAVTRGFSHPAPPSIELTHIGCCVCEQDLRVGDEYLLFILPSRDVRGAFMVSFCFPNRPVSRAQPLLSHLQPTVIYRESTRSGSLRRSIRWRFEQVGNVLARVYVKRVNDSPFVVDPLVSIQRSPWLPFSAWVAAGVLLSIAVIAGSRGRRP